MRKNRPGSIGASVGLLDATAIAVAVVAPDSAVAVGPEARVTVATWLVICTRTLSDCAVIWRSVASAVLAICVPGVAVGSTRTVMMIVAGSLARAVTVQFTVLPLRLQEPLLALGVPTIWSWE